MPEEDNGISGVWSWETCTLTVAPPIPGICKLKAQGTWGWRVEAEYKVNGEKLKPEKMTAVCQPLQFPEDLPQDSNMQTVHKLLSGLSAISREGSQLRLMSDDGKELCFKNII